MENSGEWFFLSFNLAVFSLIVGLTLQKKNSFKPLAGFLFFLLLSSFFYLLAYVASMSPVLFSEFKSVLFHAVGMIFLGGMSLYMRGSRAGKFILQFIISFYLFMFMFGKEVYSFILIEIQSLALVQPDSPFLAVLLVFLAVIAGVRKKTFLLAAGFMILTLLVYRSWLLKDYGGYIYGKILPSRLGPDVVIIEEHGGIYRKIHLSSGKEYYYRLDMKLLLNLGLKERQKAMKIIQCMEFPVIEEIGEILVLTDISVFRGNRFRKVEISGAVFNMSGPLF